MRVIVLVLALSSVAAFAKPPQSKLAVTQPILEVLDPIGSVSAAQVKEGLGKIEPYLAKCGDDSKWTGDALVWLVTDWHGKVIKVEVAANKSPVERCLVLALKRIVVPKAQGRATTMMRLRLGPSALDELE
jgi:hypothetical protein